MPDPDLRILVNFLPKFEDPDFIPGSFSPTQPTEGGFHQFPYVVPSEVVTEFVEAAYDGGWVLRDFDWMAWIGTEEAKRLYRDPKALAEATPRQLAQILTVLIRQDRFSEGSLLENIQEGRVLAVLRRASDILDSQ